MVLLLGPHLSLHAVSDNSTVLLIDDHLLFVRKLQQFLARTPHLRVVGTATTAQNGLKLTRHLQPTLVLLDFASIKLFQHLKAIG